MNDHAIIAGCFADLKLIKTRSTAQLVIEIPIEQADAALAALGGVPQSGKEKPVAVARLDPNMATMPSPAPEKPASGGNGNGADRHRLSRQAALCCQDARFRRFLTETYGYPMDVCADPADAAKEAIYALCGVESRKEFDAYDGPADTWRTLHGSFIAWREVA